MPNRTATFVPAILVASLASLALVTESHSVTPAAEACLSGPKGTPRQGGHWYYRVDRATKRHCWYVGDAGAKIARVSSPNSSASAKPPPPQNELAAQGSLADARAELPMPQPQTEPSIDVGAAQRMPTTTTDAAAGDNNQQATPDGTNLLRQALASRRPDQSSALSSTDPMPATEKAASKTQSKSKSASGAAEVQLAAADASSQPQNGSIQTLLLVIVGALALAGVMASVIFRFGSMRPAGRRAVRDTRRAIWDSVGTDRPSPPVYPRADIPARRETNASNDRIVEMLSRLSKTAAG